MMGIKCVYAVYRWCIAPYPSTFIVQKCRRNKWRVETKSQFFKDSSESRIPLNHLPPQYMWAKRNLGSNYICDTKAAHTHTHMQINPNTNIVNGNRSGRFFMIYAVGVLVVNRTRMLVPRPKYSGFRWNCSRVCCDRGPE